MRKNDSRRGFIKKSTATAAAVAFGGILPGFSAKNYNRIAGSNEKIAVASMETSLVKAYEQLCDIYKPCYKLYLANEEIERNKTHRTPSLKLHKNEVRPHEK